MTPAETITILRQFNDHRRGCGVPKPKPSQIGRALDAAVEMIDRLEEAEKDIALKERVIDALGSELNAVVKERDAAELMSLALRAKIAEMERQEPVRWGCTVLQVDGSWKEEIGIEEPPKDYFSIRNAFPLYALPGAQPAPRVPDGWKLVPIEPTPGMMVIAQKADNDHGAHEEWLEYDGEDVKRIWRAMLDVAPEAKP